MTLKELYEKWDSINLVYRIIGGLAIGVALSLLVPGVPYISMLGAAFIWALKAIAPFLVLFLVINAISSSGKDLGSRFKLVVMLYLVSTIIAAVVAVVLSFIHPVILNLNVEPHFTFEDDVSDIIYTILSNIICNPLEALVNGNFLGILFWAIIIGLFLKAVASETTRTVLRDASEIFVRLIRIVINFAPIGIMGLIYETVSTNGLGVFTEYGELLLVLIASMLFVMFVTNPFLVFLCTRKNPFPLLIKCIKGSAIAAFFTRSSAANIPVNLKLCDELELDKDFCAVSIPLGATVNMNGAAVTITVMTLAAAFSLGIHVPFFMAIALCIVAALSACGASGVNGGSLLLIPLACSLFDISNDIAMKVVAIGFIVGVINDCFETALNSSSDVMFTATADYCEREKKKEQCTAE